MTNALLFTLLFSWKANTEPDLAGYKLYHGPTSGQYTNVIALGRTNGHAMQISGKQFFALSAFNAGGLESDLANELVYIPPPEVPTVRLVSERSVDAVFWEPVQTNVVQAVYPMEFFRLRVER